MWAESSGVDGEGSTFHVTIATRAAEAPIEPLGSPHTDGLDLDARHAEQHP